MDGNKQQATSLDVERLPRPGGGGTTESGKGRRRHALTEDELARFAVVPRRQSLIFTILFPIMTLVLLIIPLLFTSWDQPTRIVLLLSGLFGVYASFFSIRYHHRNYGYHPEILFCSPIPAPTIAEAADEDHLFSLV